MSDQLINKLKTMLTEGHIQGGGKIDKLAAQYSDHALGNERCGNCENFIGPDRCHIVEGLISLGGWCKFWDDRDDLPDMDENMYASGMGSMGGPVHEKWDKATQVSPEERGKYKGKSKAELLSMYNKLKASGPHKKGSPAYGRMRELAFAIRAKGNWGPVK